MNWCYGPLSTNNVMVNRDLSRVLMGDGKRPEHDAHTAAGRTFAIPAGTPAGAMYGSW